jgi:hypothetical protein
VLAGSDAASSIETEFGRAEIVEILGWLVAGALVIAGSLLYAVTKTSQEAPAWLVASFLAVILVCALVPGILVRLRGIQARLFVGALGPTVREAGLVNGSLVVRFENAVFLSVGKGALLPASGPWMSFETHLHYRWGSPRAGPCP